MKIIRVTTFSHIISLETLVLVLTADQDKILVRETLIYVISFYATLRIMC